MRLDGEPPWCCPVSICQAPVPANCKAALCIKFESNHRLGVEPAFHHSLGPAQGRTSARNLSYLPPFLRHSPTATEYFLCKDKSLLCLVSAIVRNDQQEAARPCANQTASSA